MKRAVLLSLVYMALAIGMCILMCMSDMGTPIWYKTCLSVVVAFGIYKDIEIFVYIGRTTSTGTFVWKDRKRIFCGLPWSFTRYRMSKEKLILDEGFFNRTENEIRLYRVTDLSVSEKFGQRLFGMGTITVTSSDKTLPVLHIKNVKNAKRVKEMISTFVEEERIAKKITGREILDNHIGNDNEDEDECMCCDPLN